MTLNRREKKLLLILVLFLLIISSYIFIIEPQRQRINELNSQIISNEKRIDEIIKAKNNIIELEEEYEFLNYQVQEHLRGYFGMIEQEDIIIVFDNLLSKSRADVNAISFSEFQEEILNSLTYYSMNIHLPINGTYREVRELLTSIENYKDRIIIRSLNLNSFDNLNNNVVSAELSLMIIKINDENASSSSKHDWIESENTFSGNPFSNR